MFEIRLIGDPILNQEVLAVEKITKQIRSLSTQMLEIMYKVGAVGLAANQIGVAKGIFVYDTRTGEGPHTVINPVIVSSSEETEIEVEGCLSISGKWYEVSRPVEITVDCSVDFGLSSLIVVRGFQARVWGHEIDHLTGSNISRKGVRFYEQQN